MPPGLRYNLSEPSTQGPAIFSSGWGECVSTRHCVLQALGGFFAWPWQLLHVYVPVSALQNARRGSLSSPCTSPGSSGCISPLQAFILQIRASAQCTCSAAWTPDVGSQSAQCWSVSHLPRSLPPRAPRAVLWKVLLHLLF